MRAVALLLLLLLARTCAGTLVQVQLLHRHGARPSLEKHPFDPTNESRSTPLYPHGVSQIEALGAYVRSKYIDATKEERIEGISQNKNRPERGDFASFSSNLHRTLGSARAFIRKLYPGSLVSPLVFGNAENDWVIRGYALCDELAIQFEDFVQSDVFTDKEREGGNSEFIAGVAEKLSNQPGDFEEVYNIYDRFQIIQNDFYGAQSSSRPSPSPAKLSETEFNDLKKLADWYESHKFNFAEHNIHVATGLLQQITSQIQAKIKNTDDVRPNRIVHYSVHYPTLLSLWASLRQLNPDAAEGPQYPADRIPGFGAALILELHRIPSGTHMVRMRWFEGDAEPDAVPKFTPVAIGRGDCSEENKVDGCSFAAMERMLASADTGLGTFCRDCRSTAKVCTSQESSETPVTTTGGGDSNNSGRERLTAGAIGAVGGLAVGLLMALAYMACMARRKRNEVRYHEPMFGTDLDQASAEGIEGDVLP